MATITKGYTFAPTEQVTNTKLHDLVEKADIAGLSWSEFSGSTVGISSGSPPTSAGMGWIGAVYEPPRLDTSSWSGFMSDFNYMIETINGPVALFKHGGLETRRFVSHYGAVAGVLAEGIAAYIDTPAGNVTLAFSVETGNNGYGNPDIVGVITGSTSTTSPTNYAGSPRLTVRGSAPVYCISPTFSTAPNLRSLFGDGAVNASSMGCTNSTSVDKVLGFAMSNNGSVGLRPCFLYGAPVWRA